MPIRHSAQIYRVPTPLTYNDETGKPTHTASQYTGRLLLTYKKRDCQPNTYDSSIYSAYLPHHIHVRTVTPHTILPPPHSTVHTYHSPTHAFFSTHINTPQSTVRLPPSPTTRLQMMPSAHLRPLLPPSPQIYHSPTDRLHTAFLPPLPPPLRDPTGLPTACRPCEPTSQSTTDLQTLSYNNGIPVSPLTTSSHTTSFSLSYKCYCEPPLAIA